MSLLNTHLPNCRNDWNFSYKVTEVLEAAKKRLEFFKGRYKFWTDAKEETIAKIKADGLSFDDSLAAEKSSFSNGTANYGRQTSVKVDADLQRDLDECNSKINEHRNNVVVFAGWVEFLEKNSASGEPLKLKHGDYLFFFGELSVDASR